MKKRLIVNADGFGFTSGINKGIKETIENGIVTSVSAMANMPYIEEVRMFPLKFEHVSVGIHFNIVVGRPLSPYDKVRSLINKKGEFPGGKEILKRSLRGNLKYSEVFYELDKQVQRLKDLGINPTHFSGYQTKHLCPQVFKAAIDVSQKWNINRMRTYNRLIIWKGNVFSKILFYYLGHPRHMLNHPYVSFLTWWAHSKGISTADRSISLGAVNPSDESSLKAWISMIQNLPEGINEIRVHPGYPDEELAKYSSYVKERRLEIQILTSEKVKQSLSENDVELVSFKDI